MRYSSNDDDAGYQNWERAHHVEGKTVLVFLDGQEVPQCSVADEDEGFVVRAVLDERGHVQIDPNDGERIWIERVEGQVRVELVDR